MKKAQNNKRASSKKSNIKYEIIELPSKNDEMEKYLDLHRKEINRRVLNNIEYAMKNRMMVVEIFSFKNSNFVVMMNRKDFRENLQNIMEFSMKNQDFEACKKAKEMIGKLDRLSIFFKYNKIKK